jgi:ATP-dependent helicase YprA (DUF1998 family)
MNVFKEYQLNCMKEIEKGQDCFVCQPTGSGKTIKFQALLFQALTREPFSAAYLPAYSLTVQVKLWFPNEISTQSLVISPLVNLLKDQEPFLSFKLLKVSMLLPFTIKTNA